MLGRERTFTIVVEEEEEEDDDEENLNFFWNFIFSGMWLTLCGLFDPEPLLETLYTLRDLQHSFLFLSSRSSLIEV